MIEIFVKGNVRNRQRMTVRDNRGQILYLLEGQWGRKDDIIDLYQLNGELVLQARQMKMSPLPVFDLYDHLAKIGTIRKHPGLFGLRDSFFTIHPQKWVVAGDFEDLYFTVHKDNHLVMECEKIIKNNCDIFFLEIENEEDIPLSSLLTVLLDHYARKNDEETYYEELSQGDFDFGFLSHTRHQPSKKYVYTKTR